MRLKDVHVLWRKYCGQTTSPKVFGFEKTMRRPASLQSQKVSAWGPSMRRYKVRTKGATWGRSAAATRCFRSDAGDATQSGN